MAAINQLLYLLGSRNSAYSDFPGMNEIHSHNEILNISIEAG